MPVKSGIMLKGWHQEIKPAASTNNRASISVSKHLLHAVFSPFSPLHPSRIIQCSLHHGPDMLLKGVFVNATSPSSVINQVYAIWCGLLNLGPPFQQRGGREGAEKLSPCQHLTFSFQIFTPAPFKFTDFK